jgi:signal transduction histidine kinase
MAPEYPPIGSTIWGRAKVLREGASEARDTAVTRRVVADDIRLGAHRAALGITALALGVAFVGWMFAEIANPLLLTIWLALQGSVIAGYYVAYGVFVVTKPDDDALLAGPWLSIGRVVMGASNLLMAASVWMLLPNASVDLIQLIILLYCWYIFVQFAADTMETGRSTAMVALLLASIAAFVLWRGLPYAPAIAAFFVAFGATVVSMRGIVRRAVAEAFAARAAAQASEAALKIALAQVAAERDAKSRFIAAASHDLQQPVQAAHLYFVQMARADQPQLRAEIELAGKAAFGAAQSLLTSMLDHLRLGAQAIVPRPRDIALDDLLAKVASEAALSAEGAVEVRFVASSKHVHADPHLLARALGNLVQNAVRHSGGDRVLIVARNRSATAEIHVLDNGRGVPVDRAEAIFEEFTQGHSGARAGFGIGLASARAAIRVQGGDVRLDPRWRHGAVFSITLPIIADAEGAISLCAAA